MRVRFYILPVALAMTLASGCGGGGPTEAPADNLKRQGAEKLAAMKLLAEAIGKNDQAGINLAVETFTASNIDVKANAAEAREIVELYKSKVKGKLKGDAAAQVLSGVTALEQQMK